MEKISLIEEKFKSLFRFAIFLLFIIPISLITGPLLPEIFSFLLIIICLMQRWPKDSGT